MTAQSFYSADDEAGALVQIRSAKVSITAFCAAKAVANSVFLAVPIILLTYLLGLLYHLPAQTMHQTALSLAFGLLSLTAMTALFSSLSLMARQAQVMMSLLAFPVFVPLLIFGTAAASKQTESMFSAPMWVMLSLAILFMLTMPFVTAKALKLAIE
jgi:heme exporter protein B